ncbi:hypothetical protein B0A55_01341 [Friedmanniomyces simplex]|uniref:Uncharacterized protein n=1 Tax=Friedmanniomyces simplex TaxID=329884 RepID=A0A4U0XXR8_9PEZI|nr:hypothetical protein B0A55_01341 [Friedmanniomyces simplex]
MEAWDDDEPFQMPENDQTQPMTCCFVNNLFGIDTPPVPVCGTLAAINELITAIDRDHLFIQPHATAKPSDFTQIAYHHLKKRDEFPDIDQLRALHDLPAEAGLPLLDEWDIDQLFRQPVVVSPAFKSLDVEEVLTALIKVAKHQEIYTSIVLSQARKPVFQLGVITMTPDSYEAPYFEAQLFPSRDDADPTSTLWLYRWCVAGADGGYEEQWRALSDGSFNARECAKMLPLQPARPVKPMVQGRKRARARFDEDDDYAVGVGLPTPESNHRGKHARPDLGYPNDKPRNDLFTDSPDSITGATILHLARFYSNQELFERINAGLAAKGLKSLKEENVVTRRITCAISSQASKSREFTDEIRKGLDEARRVNGVKARMNFKTMAKKEANRAARTKTIEGA